MAKWVYTFGDGHAEGSSRMRALLGGKGANLAEMANLGLPVPPGFTITTEVCAYYYTHAQTYPAELQAEVAAALKQVEAIAGRVFGDPKRPLLVSVRSGSRASMPGMMDTVLNIGLNDATVEALAADAGDARFAYDSYRRFIQMYSSIVLGIGHHYFEEVIDDFKESKDLKLDTELSATDWQQVIAAFKTKITEVNDTAFP
jgi:pyruvate, orthophosphate dikinase